MLTMLSSVPKSLYLHLGSIRKVVKKIERGKVCPKDKKSFSHKSYLVECDPVVVGLVVKGCEVEQVASPGRPPQSPNGRCTSTGSVQQTRVHCL